MIECDVSKTNSINLRFSLGAMESTGKLPQDKKHAMFMRDPVNIEDVASMHALSVE